MQEHWALVRNDAIPALSVTWLFVSTCPGQPRTPDPERPKSPETPGFSLVVLKVRLQLAKAHEIFIHVNEQGSHGRSVENGLLTGLAGRDPLEGG